MSIFQFGGTQTANLSSNSEVVTGSGTPARGQFFSMDIQGGNVIVFDSQVSTTAGRVIAVNTYSPTVPIAYQQGLFVNNSASNTVVVQYSPFRVQGS